MNMVILDYSDSKELLELWEKLTELMELGDGPGLDSSDNKFSKVYIELNSWLHEKIFQHAIPD